MKLTFASATGITVPVNFCLYSSRFFYNTNIKVKSAGVSNRKFTHGPVHCSRGKLDQS